MNEPMHDLDNTLSRFKTYLEEKKLGAKNIAFHLGEVALFVDFIALREKTPATATEKDLLDYLGYPYRPLRRPAKKKVKKVLSTATKSNMLRAIDKYYTFLNQHEGIKNIAAFIALHNPQKKRLIPLFSLEELENLCERFYQAHGATNHYIALTLLAHQGLLKKELSRVEADDLDLHKGILTLHASQRGNRRILPLQASQIGVLMQYFNHHQRLISYRELDYLNQELKAFSPKYQDLRQLRASRIVYWIKTHGLRKAQYLAGHRRIHTTEAYLDNDIEQLHHNIERFHPLG